MNNIKGFRFHPTDEEAIQLLWDKQKFDRDLSVQVGDSVVLVITQLKHICEFDPWELPELSELETGDKNWYFFSTPKFKYRNSARKNRTTKNGSWNPTGKPRQIETIYDGERINGSKQTLVFYQRDVSKKKKENKTHWAMHELELKTPNQRSITLFKLKIKNKKVVTSTDEESQSSHSLYSSLESPGANNAIPKDPSNSEDQIIGSQAINACSEIQTQITTNEQDDDEFMNSLPTIVDLPYLKDFNQATTLAMTPQNHVAKDFIPMEHLESNYDLQDGLSMAELSPVQEAPKVPDGVEHHGLSMAELAELSPVQEAPKIPNGVEHHGLSMAELSPVQEAPKVPDGVEHHDVFSTNEQDDEFWNSIFLTPNEVEDYPEIF